MTGNRRVGLLGAIGIGLGSMLGAGVFTVWAPAAREAGSWLVAAVVLASIVATINALSTAQLAAQYPVAGGAYTFGYREWHPVAGFIAGWGFVVGKTASVAAIALTIGWYVAPAYAPWVATGAIVASWLLNARGITRTALVATGIAVVVIATLLVVMARAAIEPGVVQLSSPSPSVWGVFGAAAMVFFAFAGYARIATLGEEVTRPERNIPRAIGWALGLVVVVYVGMAVAMRHALPHDELVGSVAPVRDLAGSLGVPGLAVAVVATMAAAGSLVALMAGVGRTAMAMARQADAPRTWRRQGNSGAPWVAEGVSALAAIAAVWWGGLEFAIAMSSCAVLVYYAVANVAAAKARRAGHTAGLRLWPGVSMVGAVLCVVIAAALPWPAVVSALAVLGAAGVWRGMNGRRAAVTSA